jgi:aspartate 1-decarboxylase
MKITMMRAKLHRATVTGADLNYEGSISIDSELYKKAGMLKNEKVHIYNLDNGERFSTYIIDGGKNEICLNGAAARLVHKGDKIIIVAYAEMDIKEAENFTPKVILLGENNKRLKS